MDLGLDQVDSDEVDGVRELVDQDVLPPVAVGDQAQEILLAGRRDRVLWGAAETAGPLVPVDIGVVGEMGVCSGMSVVTSSRDMMPT